MLLPILIISQPLSLTIGLRVIDNGLGLAAYGTEDKVVDHAHLNADQKATLPRQVLQKSIMHQILLLETPCPSVCWLVHCYPTIFTPSNAHQS